MADSRNEAILEATINDTEYDTAPQSRIEELLLELKAVIESGGGGGEITIDQSLSPSSPNAVRNSAIFAALEGKADTTYVDEKILEEIGGITTFEYYPCEPGEYDAQGVPTVANPDTSHIYLTPTSGTNLNMYAYIENAFTFLGTTEVNLDGYATTADVTAAVSGKADANHNHDDRYYTEGEVDSALANKADANHDHDSRYYTETEVDTKLGGKSNAGHTHAYSEITGTPTDLVTGKNKQGQNTAFTIQLADSAPSSAAANVITIVV